MVEIYMRLLRLDGDVELPIATCSLFNSNCRYNPSAPTIASLSLHVSEEKQTRSDPVWHAKLRTWLPSPHTLTTV